MINLTGRKKAYIFLAVLALGIGTVLFYRQQEVMLQRRKAAWDNLKKVLEERVRSTGLLAGLVVDDFRINSRIVYNSDKPFASASLVKVPIMFACFYAAENKKINLKDALTLKSSHKVQGSGILKDLPDGTRFTIGELLDLMITQSDNTACNILIDLLGFDYLNDFFKGLGLKDTNLSRKMMDFRARRKGRENYTTAEDMAFCLKIIYQKKFLNRRISEKCLSLLTKQEVNDRLPARIPASIIVAHKTGLERKICHDAGIIFTPKGDFLICVLTKNAKSAKAAKRFIAQIALDVYEYSKELR